MTGSLLVDLKLSEKDYALAAGIFFVGYVAQTTKSEKKEKKEEREGEYECERQAKTNFLFLLYFLYRYVVFEIPSNILLVKSSPSRWIARIMVTWGAVSMFQA
jgi:hypothetical protein